MKKQLFLALNKMLIAAFFLAASANAVFCSDIDDYDRRLASAAETAAGYALDPEVSAGKDAIDEASKELKKLIPKSETIVTPYGEMNAENEWIYTELDAIAAAEQASTRSDRFSNISRRLNAIRSAIAELKTAPQSSATKDQTKQKLDEILKREEFQKIQEKEKSAFAKTWDRFIKWLESMMPEVGFAPSSAPMISTGIAQFLQILIYLILGSLAAFALYRIAKYFGFDRERQKKEIAEDRVILGEKIARDQTPRGLFGEAEALAADGDLRGAIRKGYIAYLFHLGEKRIIRLAGNKTNRDYLRDANSDASLTEDMRGLTVSYEKNWYGNAVSQPDDWDDFRTSYLNAVENVRAR